MSLEAVFQLKQTNVSRPRLSHSNSQQSIAASQAASEGYYSLHSTSEGSSGDSDDRSSKPTPGRSYHTPPSQHRTPQQSHERLLRQPEPPVTHLKGVGIPRQHVLVQTQHSPAVSTIVEERPLSVHTQTTQNSNARRRKEMDSESLATTPGMDETPYIRFAIDQITRDEEVRGSRMYPMGIPPDEDDYPVERLVSNDGLGYTGQEKKREKRMSQPPPKPQQPPPAPVSQKDVFVATSLPHAPLRFLPAILRPFWLAAFILLCLAMLAALIFSVIYSDRSIDGLWAYTGFGNARYFIFRYLPTLVAMIILVWLLQVQIALQRIMPFISMASESARKRSQAAFLDMYPTQFLFPKLQHFTAGQPLVGTFYLVSWLFIFTVPLLASSFNVRYDMTDRIWRWVAVQAIMWAAIALYILLVLSLIALLVFLARKETGLKWDPRSLADIIALLERSNIMHDYKGSETFEKTELKQRLAHRADRIGYWTTTRRPNDVWYGMGEEGGDTRRYSLEDGRIREKGPERGEPPQSAQQQSGDFSIRMDLRSPRIRLRSLPWYLRETSVIAFVVAISALFIAFIVISYLNSSIRLGFLPQVSPRANDTGFSPSNFLYSFVPALIATLLLLILITYDYSLRTLRPYISLSSIGGATAEQSLLVDYHARLPLSSTIAALENKHYQTAVLSFISLTSTTLPILAGGCFWTQFYPDSNAVRVSADMSAFYALCFFLALYAVSLFALFPGRRRARLPHGATSLADIISWVYQSPLVADRAFARVQTKPELVARLMGSAYAERTWAQSLTSLIPGSKSKVNLLEKQEKEKFKNGNGHAQVQESGRLLPDPSQIRYGFGIHIGRDGLEHLGIERVRRGGERSGREMVIWEEQRRQGRGEDV